MKVTKIIASILRPKNVTPTSDTIPPCPINYDPNNVTRKEYRQFVQYHAKYGINRTFKEPDRFVTETERAQRKEFSDMVKYLAENEINRVFIC